VAEQDRGSDDPQLAAIARHALHDEELIAAFAADDVDDAADTDRARALVERCPTCHDLHRDLVAIRAAITASGTATQRAETMTAPRDFRITAEDAARLRPGAPAARLAVRLGWRARLDRGVAAFGRPMGAAMATFGIVGVLVGTLTLGGGPLLSMGGAASASTPPAVDTAGAPEATGSRSSYGPLETTREGSSGSSGAGSGGGASGPVLLVAGSIVLVVAGIALILGARRTTPAISARSGN
jgi:hypothetical protein